MAETTLLSFLAPSARPFAPQVTALPPLAAYHDVRWLFAFNQSWFGFTSVLVLLVLARSAVDAVLVMLAWPHEPALPRPRFLGSLMFGVALLPFSWPYLAAVPILLGTAVALSQGGVGQTWWRQLPPARTAAWVVTTFGVLSLASALMTYLGTPGIVAVAGLAGIVDARAWYGLTAAAARGGRGVLGGRPLRKHWVPVAPLAAVLVLALVVGTARLAFTGTVRFGHGGGSGPRRRARRRRFRVDLLPQRERPALIDSVSEVGASYFAQVSHDHGLPWLAVVPLADAVTLPACPWPRNVIFIDAFHGGLLGDRPVQRIVETFLATGAPPGRDLDELAGSSQRDLGGAARLISGAAAWRMPELHAACPS